MAKIPSHKKIPIRNFDPRRIRKGFVYTAKDLAAIYDVNESIVHRWAREDGLISIDDKIPAMFHFKTIKQFLEHKRQSRKMAAGNTGDLPCLKCFMKRRACENKVVLQKINNTFWNIKGICSICGSKMNMTTPANEALITVKWGYEIVEALPKFSLIGTFDTSVTITSRNNRNRNQFALQHKPKFCPDNERIKHKYFDRVVHRFGKNKKTLDKIVMALLVFEEFSNFKDFKLFSYGDAKEFQKYLLKKYSHSMQMAYRTITYVKEFFIWLKEQDGYKRLHCDEINTLRLSLKDTEKAKRVKPKNYLDALKWQDLILSLIPKTEPEQRGQAMLSCLLLTGMRVDALISLRIGDVNLEQNYIFQDGNHVKTKFSSSNKTNFLKFKPEIRQLLVSWIKLLRINYKFNDSDPLFPKIRVTTNGNFQFERSGFVNEPIQSTSIVRQELSKQLQDAKLGHYTPHTIRNSLVALFMGLNLTAEQIKALSQNMSHKNLETTLNNYYSVNEHKQDKIIEELDIEYLTKVQKIRNNPMYQYILSQMDSEEVVNKVFEFITK